MKKLLIILIFSLILSTSSLATGNPNMGNGGGNLGGGSSDNFWYGDSGVRITIVDAETKTAVVPSKDFIRPPEYAVSWYKDKIIHFGTVNKMQYNSGYQLAPRYGGYSYIIPKSELPQIISTNTSSADIEVIRKYFGDEQVLIGICNQLDFEYEKLLTGNYKVVIEPLAAFLYRGTAFVMTATEAALYDKQVNGDLRAKMAPLSHKNLPLALFLETADLGYPAWNGSTSSTVSNDEIISSLGIGIVRFNDETTPPVIETYDYEYRTDTEVITSITVSGGESNPDNPTSVTFQILGEKYTVNNIFYPNGDSQLAWVKWTTPFEAQEFEIKVSVDGGGKVSKSTINVNVIDLDENPPPNPVADDRNDDFQHSDVPVRQEKDRLEWSVWSVEWHENWVWHSTGILTGYWCDHGWWDYTCDQYYASLKSDMNLLNDSKNPTATKYSFKSGYGVQIDVSALVSTNVRSAVSATPNAVTYFPEFNYDSYWRLLERTKSGLKSEFEFQKNLYSTFKNRTHFTPIWMPDGDYIVNTWLIDYWTPTGMLSANLTDDLNIDGNLWDDWHIGKIDPN